MALLGLSSSKLSSERNVPRVCPAINASRANPREQITGGRQGKSEREGGRQRGRGWRGRGQRKLIGSRCSSDVKLLCQPSGDPSEGTADSWTPDDRETVSCGHATKGEDPWHFDAFFFFFFFFILFQGGRILRVQFPIGILRDFARIIPWKLSSSRIRSPRGVWFCQFFSFFIENYTRCPCERNCSILFLETGGTIKFERWILSTDDLERIERKVEGNRVYFLWKIIHRLGGCK